MRKVTAVDCEEGGCFAVGCDGVFVVKKGVTLFLGWDDFDVGC